MITGKQLVSLMRKNRVNHTTGWHLPGGEGRTP